MDEEEKKSFIESVNLMVKNNSDIGVVLQKFNCVCGAKVSLSGLQRHLNTDKHITGLKARKFEKLMEKKVIVF